MSTNKSWIIRMRKTFSDGVTLLEMMIAITISMLLILLLTSVYINMHHVLAGQRAMKLHQNNALKLIDMIREEVAMAGHIGCARLSSSFNVYPLPPYVLTNENDLVINTKNITVRYQAFPSVALLRDMHGRTMLATDASVRYRPGEVMLISDCTHAEIFQAGVVVMRNNMQIIYPTMPLKYQYHKFSELGLLVMRQYYLGHDHTLMRRELDGRHVVLMTGVEDLIFARDEDGIHFSFKTADVYSKQRWRGYARVK